MAVEPILSICIPTYNRADWLRIALAALAPQVAQTDGKVELVVSDNCSSDGTPQVVEAVQAHCPIRYNRNETNIGANPNVYLLARELARGKYVWLLGDDDMARPDAVQHVLSALKAHPELDYFYVNYMGWPGHDPPDAPLAPEDFPPLPPIGSPGLQDHFVPKLGELVAGDYNCFTPIYCSIFRLPLAREAFRMDVTSEPFSTLESVSPQAVYIVETMLNQPAWYIGYPCLAVSPSTSWERYLPIYILRLLPELYDRAEKAGVAAAVMDAHRRRLLRVSARLLWRMLFVPKTLGRENFSFWEFAWKNKRFPDFWFRLLNVLSVQPMIALSMSPPLRSARKITNYWWHKACQPFPDDKKHA